MKIYRNSERGQALALIALAAIVLFGFVGLAIDGSAKLSDRRHAQNAADTAALAAALSKVNSLTNGVSDISPTTSAWATCPPPTGVLPSPVCAALITDGKDRAASNGYDGNPATNTVAVYSPPINGYYSTVANSDEYVQVIITSHVKTTVMRVLGIDQTDNILQAVAFARKGGKIANGASIASFNPDVASGCNGTMRIGGSATITLTGGGLFVNSDAPDCAMEQQGGCPPSGDPLLVINGGGITSAGNGNVDFDSCMDSYLPTITYNQRQIIIPDEVDMPDRPSACDTLAQGAQGPFGVDADGNQIYRIYPGYYEAFPQTSLLPTNKHVIMEPGVYCVNENLNWNSNTFKYLDGTAGVTIYITAGHNFTISDNSPVLLAASDEPGYEGYVIILAGNHNSIQNNCNINGGAYLDVTGTIFAPYCQITINGNSTSISEFNAQVIGWDVQLNGNNIINFNYNPDDNGKTRRRVGLMK